MRITNAMLFRGALSDLGQIAEQNERLLRQAGTGRRFQRASDDPAAAARVLRLRAEIGGEQALTESLKIGIEDLTQAELTIDDAVGVLQRARELAVQAASGALADADLEAIASEAEQLFANLVSLANRKTGNRFLFAGTESFTQPFLITGNPATGVTYQGNSDTRSVSPSPGVSFATNLPGDQVFQGGGDIFAALLQLRDAARAGDVNALSDSVALGLESGLEQLIDARTELGTIQSGLQRTVDLLEVSVLHGRESLADTEDADLVETLTELKMTESRRLAALQTAARVIQPSLMDYLA